MTDLNSLLNKLAKHSTQIILSPETLEQLEEKGISFDRVSMTNKELLDKIFDDRRKIASTQISKLPSAPCIAIPTIGYLYDEIRECIIFGLNGAAISLSAVLVEFSLKHALIKKRNSKKYEKSEWDKIERIELGHTINQALKEKVIDEIWKDNSINFKNSVRNPYLHYNIKKITKDVEARNVQKLKVSTGKTKAINMLAEENPILWCFAKRFVDRELVMDVFRFADSFVKYLFEKNE